jgi:hypothetical protein
VEVRETFTALMEISRLLNTGLDSETLAICVRLCEQVSIPLAKVQKLYGTGHNVIVKL